jgi:trehalose-phosphatase
LQLTGGKCLWEIRPALYWNKGKAALWVLKRFAKGAVPWYFGDDVTDEDAFKVLHRLGITVVVGDGRRSSAMMALRNVPDVWKLIRKCSREK